MENIFNRLCSTCNKIKIKDIQECIVDNEKYNNECIICLKNFKDNEIVSLIKCGHYYHTECIYTLFERKKTCPLCNVPLKINL